MKNKLKKKILKYLEYHGADMVGITSVDSWSKMGMVPEEFRPNYLWQPTKSIIVIGLQMPLPIVETTPSVLHMELYRTCNRKLDNIAFDLTRWLNRNGYASIFFSRDGYANINVLLKKPMAAFAHIFAASYSGLGTIGLNNTILTREYGPRIRFVSIFTTVDLPPDQMLKKNLCIRCGTCIECCPVDALTISKKDIKNKNIQTAKYNKTLCTNWHKVLRNKGSYPCGVCIKVCPIGEDRKLYNRENALRHYRNENEAISNNSNDQLYKSWMHIRSFGNLPLDKELKLENRLNKHQGNKKRGK